MSAQKLYPMEGFKGFLLPLGGHKGFGLSLFVDILAGVASGGAFSHHLKSMYKHPDEPSLTCHTFYVVDPECIMEKSEFHERMREWGEYIKATPMLEPDTIQIIPGELEYLSEQKHIKEGIPLADDLIQELSDLAHETNVQFTL